MDSREDEDGDGDGEDMWAVGYLKMCARFASLPHHPTDLFGTWGELPRRPAQPMNSVAN